MKWLLDVYTSGKGIPKDSEAGRRQFGSLMGRRRAEESVADYEQIRRDWVLGSEAFRQELLAAVVEQVGPNHYDAQRQGDGSGDGSDRRLSRPANSFSLVTVDGQFLSPGHDHARGEWRTRAPFTGPPRLQCPQSYL
jgi:hypothetical protein